MDQREKALGWAAKDSSGLLSPFSFPLRASGEEDITLKVLYCGVCHTDLSTIKNKWGNATYPVVPGHEIIGVVTDIGLKVSNFKVGDIAGIGYIAFSCLSCENCSSNFENYCTKLVPSFNGTLPDETTTYGGFSNKITINEHFAVKVPKNLPLPGTAPLLCGGITVYCALKNYGLNRPGLHLGVVGLGGLGHLAVKFGKALGMKVSVVSSGGKREEAMKILGADSFFVRGNSEEIKAAQGTMDGIIDTVPAVHDIVPLIGLLKTHGKLLMVGSPDKPLELPVYPLMSGGKSIGGSMIGGMKDMQEMLNFAGGHHITAEVEVVPMDYVNTAMERLEKGDVRYRFVIDVAKTTEAE
ncbi:hypothetical protein LUZ61_006674 [Rhynchospora tenuis]|uniref:cinnamyl-alcohol dehydrogenase n=1 Tax=Rhynchospora tenuis TaxID=198213 RepID=A0AAD6EVV8_9POAL|nr:hypothetical protein LUZ61_006674 [Rhynchospora tenuis]